MELGKLGNYSIDIVDITEFKKYYYENQKAFTPVAFKNYLKAVDIPAKFFKEQPIDTQEELLDNREVFVKEKKKYVGKVIVVVKIDGSILNACRMDRTEALTNYDKIKTINDVQNKFEHRSFVKDGYSTYIVSKDMKNNVENKVLVIDLPVLLDKPVIIHEALYSLPNDNSVVPVEHIHYLDSKTVDLYVDYKDLKSAVEDNLSFLDTELEKEEPESILRENDVVGLALVETKVIPQNYLDKVVKHLEDNNKGELNTNKLESLVLDFDEDLKGYKQVTNLRSIRGTNILKVLNSSVFKEFVEQMEEAIKKIEEEEE